MGSSATNIDFVIRFQGGGHGDGPSWVERSLKASMLGDYSAKPNRKLVQIGIGASGKLGQKPPIEAVVSTIRSSVATNEQQGVICIFGNSEGGRMAVDLGAALTTAGIPIEFIGT